VKISLQAHDKEHKKPWIFFRKATENIVSSYLAKERKVKQLSFAPVLFSLLKTIKEKPSL
jgi:ABC-type polysaccharide/polyol phosphate export permease